MRSFALGCILLLSAPTLANAQVARGNFIQRLTGRFQPAAVKDVLRQAKGAKNLTERDAILTGFVKAHAATLPVFSVVKLAKTTDKVEAHTEVLSSFARANAGKLSFKSMRDLVRGGTVTYDQQHEISKQLLQENQGALKPGQQKKLTLWSKEQPPPPSSSSSSSSTSSYGVGINNEGHLTFGNQSTGGITFDSTNGHMDISVGGGFSIGE